MHSHTGSGLSHKDDSLHYVSLFGCAALTHNLERGSFSLHIKRWIEKQIAKIKSSAGFSLGQHASVCHPHKITSTRTLTLITSITAMQIDEASFVLWGHFSFHSCLWTEYKKETCRASILLCSAAKTTHKQSNTHWHTVECCYSSIALALFLLGRSDICLAFFQHLK